MKDDFPTCERQQGSWIGFTEYGNRVVFDVGGSYIMNVSTGDRLWLQEQNGVYALPAMIGPPSELANPDFGRQD